ncbi:hypothetical protein AZE42_05819 [Rhizopogon vesiculosus]|uniref:Tc1-like transposase DDE domain-containing protein n=1 Tax=Rhizopogon vesiculosus TaxID=180088 RepID=A0A1J8R932_9AGAM|nr:hypothetical protein AZE42_05819 [Rhizopogon vesiculosus]
MDNAHIHHGEEILELTRRHGVCIVFLPPYSPDLNLIEETFSKIKAWIRRNYDLFAPGPGVLYDMREVMDIITAEDASAYIHHAGYF